MKLHGRTDSNQKIIVEALRKVGASVSITSNLGGGFPDLVVGYRGKSFLFEVKSKKGKLTPDQREFFDGWRGEVYVIRNEIEAIMIITGDTNESN